jgi:hypothetical protein
MQWNYLLHLKDELAEYFNSEPEIYIFAAA